MLRVTTAFILLTLPLHQAIGNTGIDDRISRAAASIDELNSIGEKCQLQLENKGMSGGASVECMAYFDSIGGEHFESIRMDCVSLLTWSQQAKSAIAVLPESEGKSITDRVEAVTAVCSVEAIDGKTYITKPLETIKALEQSNK